MKAICDKCKRNFKIKLKIEKIGEGIEQNYFECPECLKRYDIHKTNAISRELETKLVQAELKDKEDVRNKLSEELKRIN